MRHPKRYAGLLVKSHRIYDFTSKRKSVLRNWDYLQLTAFDWVKQLEIGRSIQPSTFAPETTGKYTHKLENWRSTHFVCCDGDNFKGIEFNKRTGEDNNPNGIKPWQDIKGLGKRFPCLKDNVFAVSQSVSSMFKEPAHRRYRLIFLFDEPIQSEQHYHEILSTLASKYPIISQIRRSPAQPVFGNAR